MLRLNDMIYIETLLSRGSKQALQSQHCRASTKWGVRASAAVPPRGKAIGSSQYISMSMSV